MANRCELAQRTTIRAFRHGSTLLIVAEGDAPTPGYDIKITERPERIYPPWYQVLRCERPGIWPDVVVPYKVSLSTEYPEDQEIVRVFHADGDDEVAIEACGDELSGFTAVIGGGACPEGADEATGFSKKQSFDDAYLNAVNSLPDFEPAHPDTLQTIRVVEIGGLYGGIAGFSDLYVRVCRTHD